MFWLKKLIMTFQQYTLTYLLGILAVCIIVACYFFPLQAIFEQSRPDFWQTFSQDPTLTQILFFSFWQASLSAGLSVLLGWIFARAFFYQNFVGKKWGKMLFSFTFVLPSMVAIFALIGIYGQSGWLQSTMRWLKWGGQIPFYGLTGILLAHLFFNLPLASRLFLQSFHSIPPEQHQLACQLGIRGWRFIRLVEWAYLRPQLFPTFSLIFMLCFSSFAIVLALGGSPKYTTLEVAIYQSIFFDFNLNQAGVYALLQFLCCFALFALSAVFSPKEKIAPRHLALWVAHQSFKVKIWQSGVLIIGFIFLISPLLYTIITALNASLTDIWQNEELWQALGFSLTIAPLAGGVALLFALAILYLSRLLLWKGKNTIAQGLVSIGMVVLAIPTLVLALGVFLLLQDYTHSTPLLCIVIIFCNAFMALPFVLRILMQPLYHNMLHYQNLCLSLNIKGWQRFRLVEWKNLNTHFRYAFALACCLSLGDFTAIALFGNGDFTSLPQLLYQQLSRYQMAEASVTAGILLALCGSIFYLIEKND